MQTLYVLGRQPSLGLAELESLIGSDSVRRVGHSAALVSKDPDFIPFSRLGGSVKVCKVLTELPFNQWKQIETYLSEAVPKYLQYVPEGKLHIGISTYGISVSPRQINASALSLKKIARQAGKSVRIVPNVKSDLNSAQVLHNKLTSTNGWELVIVGDGKSAILAQTVHVQDIDAYAARDQARPKRDARVGMLPPKLAQIIINLASAGNNRYGATVLDPFCGTGVILQEALLMGFNSVGYDLDERMVEYSSHNILEWLIPRYQLTHTAKLSVGDATNTTWEGFDFIGCETYLGRPLSSEPKPEILAEIMRDVDTIHRRFLQNVARQTKPGLRMCIAVPAWNTKNGFKHLNILDSLEKLGYTRQSFVHVRNEDLIYYRPDQLVGRELVVLTRK